MNVLKVEHCAVTTLIGEGAASRDPAEQRPSSTAPWTIQCSSPGISIVMLPFAAQLYWA